MYCSNASKACCQNSYFNSIYIPDVAVMRMSSNMEEVHLFLSLKKVV